MIGKSRTQNREVYSQLQKGMLSILEINNTKLRVDISGLWDDILFLLCIYSALAVLTSIGYLKTSHLHVIKHAFPQTIAER